MTPSSSMTCEGSGESASSIWPTCTEASPPDDGCGSAVLTGTNLGRRPQHLTAAEATRFRASMPPGRTCGRPTRLLICSIHIHISDSLMATQDCSSPEVERLKKENATLLSRIRTLEAEIVRLQAKIINVWGE